ncbi:Interleukin-36 alpha, partial [Plecturocebus cupreus]
MAHCNLLGSSNPPASASQIAGATETRSRYVAQTGLKHLGSSDPPALSSQTAEITDSDLESIEVSRVLRSWLCYVLKSVRPLLRSIQDISHWLWILQDRTLIAVPRKHRMNLVTIALISCQHVETFEKDRGNPIYLGLNELKLCLMCAKEQDIMDLYDQPKPVKPFLFYHSQSGRSSTFESVAFPGWFTTVSSEGGCPDILTQELGKADTTDFGVSLLLPRLQCNGMISAHCNSQVQAILLTQPP